VLDASSNDVPVLDAFLEKKHSYERLEVKVLGMKTNFRSNGQERLIFALGLAWASLFCTPLANAQTGAAAQDRKPTWRLLNVKEGRSIVNAAWEQEQPAPGTKDCSHVVHDVYMSAGYEYRYDSSFELFTGDQNFVRVRFPHPGDLIVWPGHVGIVVDPLQHSFYSLVSTGLEEQDYEGSYWKSRGRPRFYRYKVQIGGVLSAAKAATEPPQLSNVKRQDGARTLPGDRSSSAPVKHSGLNRASRMASDPSQLIYGSSIPAESTETAITPQTPSSIIVAVGIQPPTREEVAEGISELSDAAGNTLRTDDPFRAQLPTVIMEQFSVEHIDIKGDHGWARLAIDWKLSISGGTTQVKRRREKIRWELRRTESGWQAVAPPDRTFVPHDVAVKNLAGQLSRLAESEGASPHRESSLRQESQLANLLSALLQ